MEELNAVQNEKLMDETIKHELERIKDLTPGSNEYKAAYEFLILVGNSSKVLLE